MKTAKLDNPFNFFDKIYCLNLPAENNFRRKHMEEQFEKIGILDRVEFIWAERPLENLRMSNLRRHPPGELGCTLSHMKAVIHALNENVDNVLIFEDDVIFYDDTKERLQTCLNELPKDWATLYLHGNPMEPTIPYSNHLVKVNNMVLNNAYAINGPHILPFFDHWLDGMGSKNASYDIVFSKYAKNTNSFLAEPFVSSIDRNFQSTIALQKTTIKSFPKNKPLPPDVLGKTYDWGDTSLDDIDNTFVFIAGLHRSATTLMHTIVREHPQISGFTDTEMARWADEGQHLQTVYPIDTEMYGPGTFAFDKSLHMTETNSLATHENAIKLFDEWKKYWDLSKPYLLEKSPPNLTKLRFLQALFPKSKFVVGLRHPIPTAIATKNRFRKDLMIPALMEHWFVAHEQFLEDAKYIKNLHVYKYENLVIRPEQTLKEIYNFIGVDYIDPAFKVQTGINEKYFLRWQGALHDLVVPDDFEARANRFGYCIHNYTSILPFTL